LEVFHLSTRKIYLFQLIDEIIELPAARDTGTQATTPTSTLPECPGLLCVAATDKPAPSI